VSWLFDRRGVIDFDMTSQDGDDETSLDVDPEELCLEVGGDDIVEGPEGGFRVRHHRRSHSSQLDLVQP